jgi:predicted GNAT superfamily acetyltransferase
VLRPLATLEEREACVALQEETWGHNFRDRVPGSILMVAGEIGGVVSGAFEDGRLVGFVFGLTGVRDGRLVHWSDMLAVRDSHRGRGLGLALKLHQRERLLAAGVETVLWTFDPLESRNAHLNLRRLGAIAKTYHRDLYGPPDSPLHAGIGTDRLLAEWPIASDRVRRRLDGVPDDGMDGAPLLNPARAGDPFPRPSTGVRAPAGDAVRVAFPRDIQRLKVGDGDLARAWRLNVREALERSFAAGYVATDVAAGGETSEYLLVNPGFEGI